jgi:hypothetical protein
MGAMDSAATELPKDGPVIIITASFEGKFKYCEESNMLLTLWG